MSLLKIPQGWKPKNQPADPRGYYDPRIYLPRMAAKLAPAESAACIFNKAEILESEALTRKPFVRGKVTQPSWRLTTAPLRKVAQQYPDQLVTENKDV